MASGYTPAHAAPVAQLDRALPSEGRGHRFESCRVRHFRLSGWLDVHRPGAKIPYLGKHQIGSGVVQLRGVGDVGGTRVPGVDGLAEMFGFPVAFG